MCWLSPKTRCHCDHLKCTPWTSTEPCQRCIRCICVCTCRGFHREVTENVSLGERASHRDSWSLTHLNTTLWKGGMSQCFTVCWLHGRHLLCLGASRLPAVGGRNANLSECFWHTQQQNQMDLHTRCYWCSIDIAISLRFSLPVLRYSEQEVNNHDRLVSKWF